MMFCVKVVEWILGPAEKLLASQTGIGDSFTAADELRKKHEQLELKCTVSSLCCLFIYWEDLQKIPLCCIVVERS